MRDVWAFNDRIERLPTQLRCLHNGYNAGSEITIFTCMHGLALSGGQMLCLLNVTAAYGDMQCLIVLIKICASG